MIRARRKAKFLLNFYCPKTLQKLCQKYHFDAIFRKQMRSWRYARGKPPLQRFDSQWLDEISILQRNCLIDKAETIKAAHLTITSTTFIKQGDGVDCGPIACATLASLLLEEEVVFLGQLDYFLPKNVPNLRSRVVDHYLNLVTRFGNRLYWSGSAKWVKKYCNTKPLFVPEWYVSSWTVTPQDGEQLLPDPVLPKEKSPSSNKTPTISKEAPCAGKSAERKLKPPPPQVEIFARCAYSKETKEHNGRPCWREKSADAVICKTCLGKSFWCFGKKENRKYPCFQIE